MVRNVLRESVVGTALVRARQRLGTLAADSRLWHLLASWRDTISASPQTGAGTTRLRDHLRRIIAASGTAAVLGRAGTALRTAGRYSMFAASLPTVATRYVTGSWLYRWLTAEPDPDVIVIDLRETWTVGPWLAALERGLRWLLPATASSVLFALAGRTHRLAARRPVQLASLLAGSIGAGLLALTVSAGEPSEAVVAVAVVLLVAALFGSRIPWNWSDLQETRGYQALAVAFEPPDPPDSADRAPSAERETQTDGTAERSSEEER